ncbi:MAG: MOSC domain-containing protein [Cellulomonas sp.]
MTSIGSVVAVSRSAVHAFAKVNQDVVRLAVGVGVEGDAHSGASVQHVSRRRPNPPPNLRQVHLIQTELFDELAGRGFTVAPGDLGENISTRGIDLLGLPVGTRLHLGGHAVVELTGLRNPCKQIDGHQDGLMRAVLDHDADGNLVRKAGVMSVVLVSGLVHPGDVIEVELPDGPHTALAPV